GERTGWQRRDLVEFRVVDLDGSGAEVGNVDQGHAVGIRRDDRRAAGRDCQPFVDRPGLLARVGVGEVVPGIVDGYHRIITHAVRAGEVPGWIDAGVPADDGPVFGYEEERGGGRGRLPALAWAGDLEGAAGGAGVEYRPCRCAAGAANR